MDELEVIEARDGEVVRLALVGELDLASVPVFNAKLAALGDQGMPGRLDLSRLDFIDSSGASALIRAIDGAPRVGLGSSGLQ